MENIFFSIIIPVYNGIHHRLDSCLSHIWKQYRNNYPFEVICVDDCSTDGTKEWIEEQQVNYPNLKLLVNKYNLRQGGARNEGVKNASGKYIIFIDQDDYIDDNAIESLYNILSADDLDLLLCDYVWQMRGKESKTLVHYMSQTPIMTGESYLTHFPIAAAPWRFVFKKELMLEKHIWFAEHTRIEDIDWGIRMTYHAKKMIYAPLLLIHHNRDDGSTTFDIYKNPQVIYDMLGASKRVYELTQNELKDSSIQKIILNCSEHNQLLGLKYLFGVKASFSEKKKCLSNMPQYITQYPILNFVKRHSYIFCLLAFIFSPLYRITLYFYRAIYYR